VGKASQGKGKSKLQGGEFWCGGGVILFEKQGKPRYTYLEQAGEELPVDDIVAALNAVRDWNNFV